MSYLDRLARLVTATRLADLSASTIAAAKAVTLDTLGAILAGSRLAENAGLAKLAVARSGARTATLIGHGERAEPMFATLANATAGVALEMDEGNRWGGGHPSIHVLPGALAVSEELGVSGPRFIEALVAGYEVTSRIGGATRVRPNVHSHGTWGTLGTAAAVAHLHGLDAPAVRAAISLAGSMTPANTWTPCFEGATIRNVYPGRSGLQGILAVHLLSCGFTALADAPADVYDTILAEAFDPAAVTEGLGATALPATFRIERNYFKFHACCLYNHPALDAVTALRAEHRLTPESVARVDVTSLPFVERMADPAPPAMLAAKFSVPHAVAAALVLGRTDVTAFFDDARTDARVRDLAGRVDVRGDAAMSMRSGDRPTARVTITLADGRTLTRETAVVHGDAANPASRQELIEKFSFLATDVIGKERVADVVATVDRLERLTDVRELTALLAS
jgi:2-methylcitrate dehydratase PrpD